MRTFADSKSRQWTIDLSVGCVRRIKSLLGVDLTMPEAMVDAEGRPDAASSVTLAQRVASSLLLAVDVAFAAVKPQADDQGITDEEFADGLGGEACRHLCAALKEEWQDFFLQRGEAQRAELIRATYGLEAETDTQRAAAIARLTQEAKGRIAAEIQDTTDKAIRELSGSLSTSSPGSSE